MQILHKRVISRAYLSTGLIVLALGVYVISQAATLHSPEGYTPAGPELFPYIIGFGLTALGVALLVKVFVGSDLAVENNGLHWGDIGLVLGGLASQIAFLDSLGWIISATLLFVMGARAFGAHRIVLDLVVGLVLSIGTVLLFSEILGLRLPAGIFGGLFG